MRFPWYWFRESSRKGYTGPKKAAFVLDSGVVVRFNYDHAGQEKARKVDMTHVVIICDQLQNGTWNAEWSKEPYSNHGYVVREKSLKSCIKTCQRRRERYLKREGQIQASPDLLLAREIRHRDWTSHMSDDYRCWAAGEASDRRIMELLPRCNPERVKKIWARYAPKGFPCPI